jgi:hypothetical protein
LHTTLAFIVRRAAVVAAVAAAVLVAAPLASADTVFRVGGGKILPFYLDEGGGSGNAACGSAWVDKHDDTWSGSYGIHGTASWCWDATHVWNVSIDIGPWVNGRYSVERFSQYGAGAACGGGAGTIGDAVFRWEPLPGVWVTYGFQASISVCPGGWGTVS